MFFYRHSPSRIARRPSPLPTTHSETRGVERQTACKPGSVPAAWAGDGHSSGTPVAGRLARPTRTAGAETRLPRTRRGVPSLFGLAPGGVCRAAGVTVGAVRSYRTLSPLPAGRGRVAPDARAGGLLSVALSLGSPPPGVTRHRVSVEPGLSSPRLAPEGGRPAVWHAIDLCSRARRVKLARAPGRCAARSRDPRRRRRGAA